MTPTEAEDLYGFHRWGAGYFSVGERGRLRVHPTRDAGLWVDLPGVVAELRDRSAPPPVVLRFPQMIESQLGALHASFRTSIERFEYSGRYRGVFPIKVNQTRSFLGELVRCSKDFGHGLECGTKPELALALAAGLEPGSLVICNGYKDRDYVELALAGAALGLEVVLVAEKLHELELILDVAEERGVRPVLGLRLRIHARGTGKWARSGGDASKFGLSTAELLESVGICRRRGWADRLQLLHFHIGSQITDIRRIKKGVQEGARFYAALRAEGFDLRYLDVGGGLGVDYDGSRTATDSSMNYSLEEYTNDVVYAVQEVCDAAGIPSPDLISESGRHIAAYHSMVVFSVERQQTLHQAVDLPPLDEDAEPCVRELVGTLEEMGPKNFMECYHDTLELAGQMHMLFELGRVSLVERAVGEDAVARIFRDVVYYARTSGRRVPEEIDELEQGTATKYVCNLSVFQSMPDLYSLGQLFPVAPIHRLDEQPSVWATIQDITCDSDGKIDRFGDVREDRDAIRLHELRGETYDLATFLVGAYQDVMGDFHNMLGETLEARVVATGPGEASVEITPVIGQSAGDVLSLFGHGSDALRASFDDALARAGADAGAREPVMRALDRVLSTTPYLAQQD